MDEFVICSVCQNKPIYVCNCYNKQTFLCKAHALPHVNENGNHNLAEIMKNPHPQTKLIISIFLKDIKLKAHQDRIKIIQESKLLINQIKLATSNALEKLLAINKKADEYLSLCGTLEEINNSNNNSFIESLLNLSAEDAAKIKFHDYITKIHNDNLKEKIENLFIVYESKNLFNRDNFWVFKPQFLKYFKGNNLFAVDIVSQNSTPQNINKNIAWNPTCLLDDGSIFCCFQGETFIITHNNSIIPLNSSQWSSTAGAIAVDDFVYMFGGASNVSLRFSLKSNDWMPLAQYPAPGSSWNSSAYLNNFILICGYNLPCIYGYNIRNNSYTNALITLSSNTGKNCLATKDKTYIIEYGQYYYESGLNDINSWTRIGSANMLQQNSCRHSFSLLYKDCFYFVTYDYKLIQFDFQNKIIKNLKPL